MFSALKWLSFPERIKYQKAILMYKCLNGLLPDYISLQENENHLVNYNLRFSENKDLFLQRPKTNFYKKSFKYSGVKLWNDLPLNIKTLPNVEIFKSKCFDYYFQNQSTS